MSADSQNLGDRWYYAKDKKKVGPVSVAELRRLLASGVLKPEDMVLQEGARNWRPVREVVPSTSAATAPDNRLRKVALGAGVAAGALVVLLVLLGWLVAAMLSGSRATEPGETLAEGTAPAVVTGNVPSVTPDAAIIADKHLSPDGQVPRAPFGSVGPARPQRASLVVQLGGSTHSVAFSPDGKQVLSGDTDNTARLWDAVSGRLIHALQGQGQAENFSPVAVAFSRDGNQCQ